MGRQPAPRVSDGFLSPSPTKQAEAHKQEARQADNLTHRIKPVPNFAVDKPALFGLLSERLAPPRPGPALRPDPTAPWPPQHHVA
jgi:hypothetical protein